MHTARDARPLQQDFQFGTEEDLCRFAADLALALSPGDCILLQGDLGAGKTTFARAAIRSLAGDRALEIPSPTFTLVQAYQLRIPVAHLDLYRITHRGELDELGLSEALDDGVAFVEWPENAAGGLPGGSVFLAISETPGTPGSRHVSISAVAGFFDRLHRSLTIRAFLEANGWGSAERRFLLGDASARTYETIHRGHEMVILMDAPKRPDGPPIRDGKPYSQIAHLAEDITPFVALAGVLADSGFRAPKIYAFDLENGLVLLQHLGQDGVLDNGGVPVPERFETAVECLSQIHAVQWPTQITVAGKTHSIPEFDLGTFLIETELLVDWYVPGVTGQPLEPVGREKFRRLWTELFKIADKAEKTLVLRDFHSPNIIWNEAEETIRRVGLIDFQDALIGPAAYDVASIVQDARADVPESLRFQLLDRYCGLRSASPGFDEIGFRTAFAILCAQRATKILGIFVRLHERDGKPFYLRHIPRMQNYLRSSLAHPALAELALWYEDYRLLDVDITKDYS